MVWVLTSTGKDSTKYLLDSFPYTVGRLDCSLLLPEDRSVSRRHAYLAQDTMGETLLLVDADSKFGTFLNAKEIVKNRDVEVRDGDVVRFGVMTSEFIVMLVDITIFVPSDSLGTHAKFCRRVESVDEATYILLTEGFEATLEIARLVATGKPVVNNKYLDDCIKKGQLLEDVSYRITFPRTNLELRPSPSHTFLTFFGVRFEEGANVVIGQNTSSTWISEECLLRACLLGMDVQLNEPLVETLAADSAEELIGISKEYKKVSERLSEISRPIENGTDVASHALMISQLASLCRHPQGVGGDTPASSSTNTKKFVKNLPLVRRRHRGLPTIVSMETCTKRSGATFEEEHAVMPSGGIKEVWLVEEKKVMGKRRTLATPEHQKKDKVVELGVGQQPGSSVTSAAVKSTPVVDNQFKSTFFKSLKK